MRRFGTAKQVARYLALALFLLCTYTYFFPRWADWNQNSRLDVVMAVVDQGTWAIDAYVQNTGDYALYEGHYYGEKAPGTAFLGIPVYWAFKVTIGQFLMDRVLPILSDNPAVAGTLTEGGRGLISESLHFMMAQYVVTFFTVSLPAALFGLVFYHFLGYITENEIHRVLLVLAYGLATIAFPYSGAYFGHQIAAILLFVAFWILLRIKRRELKAGFLGMAGFLLGYSAITEYPTVFAAGLLFLYALVTLEDKRQAVWMIVGGVPPVLALMIYNAAIFGAPWEFSYKYSELWVDYHHTGFFGTTLPDLKALWGITFSPYRGLFFLSPFLLLAVPGFWRLLRRQQHWLESLVSLLIVVSMVLFNSASKMWFGGHSVGPRYLVPILPFLVWPIAAFLDAPAIRCRKLVFGVLTAVSVAFVWIETISGQGFPQYSPNPLFDYSWPQLVAGDIARNWGTIVGLPGAYSLLPLVAILGLLAVMLALSFGTKGDRAAGPTDAVQGTSL